ncbi:MAG: response regulator [Vicinamibacteria bacterium]|nr:response regulator [Vicinamibacteria bacterium]
MVLNDPSAATRILLVEDEAIIALDLRQRLEDLGYVVTGIAVNGADALALAEATSPTLVFMDITIQGPIDGIETARTLTSRRDVPVVFLTAHADARTIERAKAAKPYGYLVKPFDERELSTTIEMAVYRHRTESEARLLQQAIGSANVGIVVADTHEPLLPITMCNAAFEKITGYSAAEAMGQSAWFVEGKDTDPLASAEVRRAIQEQRECQVSLLMYRKDGSPFWDDLALSPVRNSVGEVTHFLFFHTDASARRHAETALFQSQKVEAIGQLAGGVAHDFNNILAVITGYCEMAQRQIDAAHPARPRLDQILKAANRAAGLTRQLLAFSRKQVMQPRPVDLNVIVADTHKMLGRLIGENISVVLKPAVGLGTIHADPGQIEQIVLNLAVNARDAMPRGGTLTLETRNVDLDEDYAMQHPGTVAGRYVLFAVSDTGIGMTPEIQAKAFDPFFTTKPEGQGTGLGLATVYGIVKQSGGNVWVYSEPGRGTTFRIYLPRVDRPNANLQPEAPPSGETPRGTETILLAEDTDSLREVIQETLLERGYKVLAAADGREALAVARAHPGPVDLLLTDVVMPNMGGAELAAALSQVRPSLPVLYMSGYTDGALSHHGVLAEGIMLIEKPFTGDLLCRRVREALDRPAPGASPR